MEVFKKILADEAEYKLSEETMDKFCSYMEEIHLKRYDYMIKSDVIFCIGQQLVDLHDSGHQQAAVGILVLAVVLLQQRIQIAPTFSELLHDEGDQTILICRNGHDIEVFL